jgi:hypothetical protein|tara:strand:+ start:662 stop:1426 length:765 start_codon:yes stop_codon:yes gene_type:complete
MNTIELIFDLSIVYVIYNLVWWLIVKVPKGLIMGFQKNISLDYVLSTLKFLILSNITFSNCLHHIQNNSSNDANVAASYIIGGLFLFVYMVSKLNKKRSLLTLATNFGLKSKFNLSNSQSDKLKYENHIIGISMVVYTACIGFSGFGELIYLNPLNIWFNETIQGLSQAPILKGVFGVFAVFFMLSIFQKGINSIKDIVLKLSGQKTIVKKKNPFEEVFNNVNKNPFSEPKENKKIDIEDDLFIDFEEIDEKEK